MKTPLNIDYNGLYSNKRTVLTDSEQIAAKSESVAWAKIGGDWGTNKFGIVEAAKNSTSYVVIGKILAKEWTHPSSGTNLIQITN